MPSKIEGTIPGSPEEWLIRAKSNLALARADKPDDVFWEDMCYNAQQAAEKAIKAALQYYCIPFRYIHDMEELIGYFGKSGIDVPSDLKQATVLTKYAIETRYPGHFDEITEDDYRYALELAERLLVWAEGVISSPEQSSEAQ